MMMNSAHTFYVGMLWVMSKTKPVRDWIGRCCIHVECCAVCALPPAAVASRSHVKITRSAQRPAMLGQRLSWEPVVGRQAMGARTAWSTRSKDGRRPSQKGVPLTEGSAPHRRECPSQKGVLSLHPRLELAAGPSQEEVLSLSPWLSAAGGRGPSQEGVLCARALSEPVVQPISTT